MKVKQNFQRGWRPEYVGECVPAWLVTAPQGGEYVGLPVAIPLLLSSSPACLTNLISWIHLFHENTFSFKHLLFIGGAVLYSMQISAVKNPVRLCQHAGR